MSNELREYVEFFKDRVDELFILEKKIAEKADALTKVAQNCLASHEAHMNKAFLRVESASHSFDRMNHAAEKVEGYIDFCARHVKFAVFLFLGNPSSGFMLCKGGKKAI